MENKKIRYKLGAMLGIVNVTAISFFMLIATLATGWHGYPGWGGMWVLGTAIACIVGAIGGGILMEVIDE